MSHVGGRREVPIAHQHTSSPPLSGHVLQCAAPTPMNDWDLHLTSGPTGPIIELRLTGEIDSYSLPAVCTALVAALDEYPVDLAIDLSQVTFCGVRGFAILDAAARATATACTITGLGRHLERAAMQVWRDQRPSRHRGTGLSIALSKPA